jgi:carboxypeptidase family protein
MKRLAIFIACWLAGAVVLACVVMLFFTFGPLIQRVGQPRDTVQGTVLDRDSGAPVSGASLVCISGFPLSFFEHRDEVKTDARGRFTLPIQHKDYHVEVRKPGYRSQTILWLPPEERHERMRFIRLSRRAGG